MYPIVSLFFPCKPGVLCWRGSVSVQQGEVLVWGNGWPLIPATCYLTAGLTVPGTSSFASDASTLSSRGVSCIILQDSDTCCYSNTWLIFSLTHWRPRQIFTFTFLCEFGLSARGLTAQYRESRLKHFASVVNCCGSPPKIPSMVRTWSILSFDMRHRCVLLFTQRDSDYKHFQNIPALWESKHSDICLGNPSWINLSPLDWAKIIFTI